MNSENKTGDVTENEVPVVLIIRVKKPSWLVACEDAFLLFERSVPEFDISKRGTFLGDGLESSEFRTRNNIPMDLRTFFPSKRKTLKRFSPVLKFLPSFTSDVEQNNYVLCQFVLAIEFILLTPIRSFWALTRKSLEPYVISRREIELVNVFLYYDFFVRTEPLKESDFDRTANLDTFGKNTGFIIIFHLRFPGDNRFMSPEYKQCRFDILQMFYALKGVPSIIKSQKLGDFSNLTVEFGGYDFMKEFFNSQLEQGKRTRPTLEYSKAEIKELIVDRLITLNIFQLTDQGVVFQNDEPTEESYRSPGSSSE